VSNRERVFFQKNLSEGEMHKIVWECLIKANWEHAPSRTGGKEYETPSKRKRANPFDAPSPMSTFGVESPEAPDVQAAPGRCTELSHVQKLCWILQA
jgi:hypothetical protein